MVQEHSALVNMPKFSVQREKVLLWRREIEDCFIGLSTIEMHTDIKKKKTDSPHSLPALKSHQGFSHFYIFRGCAGKIKSAQQELF